jgi:hypothetical protein
VHILASALQSSGSGGTMPYWISEDGKITGPMTAVDVLWQAGPGAQISDGGQWFRLDEEPDAEPTADPAPARPERIVIRTSAG